jgi:hypothetical protein
VSYLTSRFANAGNHWLFGLLGGRLSMDHVLSEQGLRLTYLCDPDAIDELDQDRLIDDLSDDTPGGDPLPWLSRCRLADYDHLVLVTDRRSGRHLAFLGAGNGTTIRDDFLLLKSAFVATAARGQNLMRRMIAFAMLRIGGMNPVPSVIVARTRNPLCYRIMRGMVRHFSGAVFLPDPDSVAINFRTAAMALRIAREIGPDNRALATIGTIRDTMMIVAGTGHRGPSAAPVGRSFDRRMLAVLDLRERDEATILTEARRLYRSR